MAVQHDLCARSYVPRAARTSSERCRFTPAVLRLIFFKRRSCCMR